MLTVGRLHIITDTSLQRRYSHIELAALALEGGADVIQYRRKDAATRLLLEEARAMAALCRPAGVPLIVNDRADVALAADAGGVHLGDMDLPIPIARDLLGAHRLIGGSADNAEEAVASAREGADYVGIGPVYATTSKRDTGAVLGLDGLARAVAACGRPLIAIGGVTLERLPEILATGVHGVAVLSAFCAAEDPSGQVRAMQRCLAGFPLRDAPGRRGSR
mgnify:CR=1 FL=1